MAHEEELEELYAAYHEGEAIRFRHYKTVFVAVYRIEDMGLDIFVAWGERKARMSLKRPEEMMFIGKYKRGLHPPILDRRRARVISYADQEVLFRQRGEDVREIKDLSGGDVNALSYHRVDKWVCEPPMIEEVMRS